MKKQFTITRTPLVQRIKSAIWRFNYRSRMNFTRKERVAECRRGRKRLADYNITRECITF